MSGYEVLAVRYATRTTRESLVYLNHHFLGAEDGPLVMDYFFWVIRNEERTIIIDTGFTPETGSAHGRTMTTPVPDGLRRIGVDPADVHTVVITHGHYDHTGNIGLFPNARLVIADSELKFWTGPLADRLHFRMVSVPSDIELILERERAGQVDRMRGELEIVPGVRAIEVGGHTPGQLVVVVDNERPVLLASDAVHYYAEVERDWPFVIATHLDEMYEAFDTVKKLSEVPGTDYVAGHDPLVLERFSPIDPEDPGLGAQIA